MINFVKIKRYLAKQRPFHFKAMVSIALLALLYPSVSSAQNTVWKLFLNSSYSEPILQETTTTGERFIINSSDLLSPGTVSAELLEALDGISFSVDSPPVDGSLTLNIILKTSGNEFVPVIGVDVLINFELEAYVNGSQRDDSDFFRNAPLRMIIPAGAGLEYLLGLCDARRNDIIFANYNGGKLDQDDIETLSQVQGIVAEISGLDPVVGGKCTDFGFPAAIQYSTWFKVKKLFE